jgi:hypothetical protein
VNIWTNLDYSNDNNAFYYGDSFTGNVYSLNAAAYLFDATAITSTIKKGALNLPDSEIRINAIEFKAYGSPDTSLTFTGYAALSGTPVCTGTITLTGTWKKYKISTGLTVSTDRTMVGDFVDFQFTHSDSNKYFKIKDIVIYPEKKPDLTVATEVALS